MRLRRTVARLLVILLFLVVLAVAVIRRGLREEAARQAAEDWPFGVTSQPWR